MQIATGFSHGEKNLHIYALSRGSRPYVGGIAKIADLVKRDWERFIWRATPQVTNPTKNCTFSGSLEKNSATPAENALTFGRLCDYTSATLTTPFSLAQFDTVFNTVVGDMSAIVGRCLCLRFQSFLPSTGNSHQYPETRAVNWMFIG